MISVNEITNACYEQETLKSRYNSKVYSLFLKMLCIYKPGYTPKSIQQKAYSFLKDIIYSNKKVSLVFWVCPEYYIKLRFLLETSYNCIRGDNDKTLPDGWFESHFFICECDGCVDYEKYGIHITSIEELLKMTCDLIVMNPPYDGEGDPLYMRITKAMYDNCLNDSGKLISINPTGVVDTLYSDAKMKVYSDSLLLEDFVFDDRLRNAFSADIKSGIGIFTYSKRGKHRLDSDWVRSIRFGEKTWQMRKQIIEKVGHFIENGKGLTDMTNFGISDKNIVIINQHTGSKDSVTGKYKYDWPVLHSNQYFIVQTKLPEKPHFAIGFPIKGDAISFLKWINTDFVMFFVMTYKKHIRNTKTTLALIPQPPKLDGNYSDEVLMKHFNLTQEEMDWIHSEMKGFGWKVNLGKTESELMAYIDEINK